MAKKATVEIDLKSRLFYRKVFQPTVVPQSLSRWNPFNVKINGAICFEQGETDLQIHIHEWLQQWWQLWKLKDIIATGKRPQVHRLVCDHFYYHKLFHYHGYNLLQKGWRHQLIYLAKMVYQALWNSSCSCPLDSKIVRNPNTSPSLLWTVSFVLGERNPYICSIFNPLNMDTC